LKDITHLDTSERGNKTRTAICKRLTRINNTPSVRQHHSWNPPARRIPHSQQITPNQKPRNNRSQHNVQRIFSPFQFRPPERRHSTNVRGNHRDIKCHIAKPRFHEGHCHPHGIARHHRGKEAIFDEQQVVSPAGEKGKEGGASFFVKEFAFRSVEGVGAREG
jgi:hypothetical protein